MSKWGWPERDSFSEKDRALILKRDPWCVMGCGRASTVADHEPNYRTLVRAGVADPNHIRYGQGMCDECHDAKTRREQREGLQLRYRPERQHPGRS